MGCSVPQLVSLRVPPNQHQRHASPLCVRVWRRGFQPRQPWGSMPQGVRRSATDPLVDVCRNRRSIINRSRNEACAINRFTSEQSNEYSGGREARQSHERRLRPSMTAAHSINLTIKQSNNSHPRLTYLQATDLTEFSSTAISTDSCQERPSTCVPGRSGLFLTCRA